MKLRSEPILAVVTLILLIIVFATRSVDMSLMTQTMILGLFVVGFFGYAAFIYRERPVDEREQGLSLIASKYAYMFGSAVLSLGIVVQSLDHDLDIWLPAALGSMVIAKSFGHFIHNK